MQPGAKPSEEIELRLVEEAATEREELHVGLKADRGGVTGEIRKVERRDLALLDAADPRLRRMEQACRVPLPHAGGDAGDSQLTADICQHPSSQTGRFVERPGSGCHGGRVASLHLPAA